MVKKFLEQTMQNRNFEARNDGTAIGASAKQGDKGDEKRGDREQGECYLWTAKGKCSKQDSCSFKHDMSKRGKGINEREITRSS